MNIGHTKMIHNIGIPESFGGFQLKKEMHVQYSN